MKQGRYGVSLAAVAIIAFVLAFFDLLIPLILILGFAVLLEKNQWLSRQSFQALYLNLAYSVVVIVIGWLFTAFNALFGLFNWYGIASVFGSIHNTIRFLLRIVLFIFALLAVFKLAKGDGVSLPFLSSLADKTLGLVKPKEKSSAPAAPAAPQQPAVTVAPAPAATEPASPLAPPPPPTEVAPIPAQEPQSLDPSHLADEATPASQPQEATVSPPAEEPKPAPAVQQVPDASWTCVCGRINTGNFCIGCGSRRP